MMTTKPPPAGFHTVTPYLVVEGAAKLIEFLTKAFVAEQTYRQDHPDGSIMHAQVRIGNSVVMLSDARPEYPRMAAMMFLYVDSADEAYQSALTAGATSIRPPEDSSHGDRMGGVLDPFGIQWWVANPMVLSAEPH